MWNLLPELKSVEVFSIDKYRRKYELWIFIFSICGLTDGISDLHIQMDSIASISR